MDIEIMERQLRDLVEWKARYAPMLESQWPEWEKYLERQRKAAELKAKEKAANEQKAAEGQGAASGEPGATTGQAPAGNAAGDAPAGGEKASAADPTPTPPAQ